MCRSSTKPDNGNHTNPLFLFLWLTLGATQFLSVLIHSDLIEYETVEQTYNHDRLIQILQQTSVKKSAILIHINILLMMINNRMTFLN